MNISLTPYVEANICEIDENEIWLDNIWFKGQDEVKEYGKSLAKNPAKAKYIAGLLMGDIRDYWGEAKEERLIAVKNLLEGILKHRKDRKVEEDLRTINNILENSLADFDGRWLRDCNLYVDTSSLRVKNLSLDDLVYLKLNAYSSFLLDPVIETLLKRTLKTLLTRGINITHISNWVKAGSSLSKDDLAKILKEVKEKIGK